jgi:AcrR family transcriptional regulator
VKRLAEMFETYERFVVEHRGTIQAFLRFMAEAPEFRPALRDGLLGLHERFAEDVHAALVELLPGSHDARSLASGLVSLLDGNLLLGLVESDGAREARRAGLRAVLSLLPNRKETP